MADDLTTVQIDTETREILRSLAKEDLRSMASELQWLVNQEKARRFSRPNPLVTVADAQAAAGTGDRLVAQDALSAPEGR